MKKNIPVISIDVEDWLQSTWNRSLGIHQRAADNTLHLLDLLDELDAKTTMFILGKFAAVFPNIVKEIQKRGHEIASHGYGHEEIFTQTPAEFRKDLKMSKDILEDLTGADIYGFRAPDFSIMEKNLWALEIISEEGFVYDSSINPIQHPRYGISFFPNHPVYVELENGKRLLEFPIASFRFKNKNYPVGGGGYHRLLPGWAVRYMAGKILDSTEFIFYCHPYEFNGNEFKEIEEAIPLKTALHQGLGRGKIFENRFKNFIKKYGSQRMIDLINEGKKWPTYLFPNYSTIQI